ncbi:MAG TPA: LysR family transcriptional regulator [Polyangiaceae bacterium]
MSRIIPLKGREKEAKPRLDIHDLEVVLAVAKAGTTVRAAKELHVTQSAVSRGLLLAEEKVGAKLFDRGARGLVPTAAGKRLVEGAPAVLATLADLEHSVCAPSAKPRDLRVACECYTAYRWLPSTLARLKSQRSTVGVALMPEHTRTPADALEEGAIDIALLTTARTPKGCLEAPLFTDEVVFLVAASHPLAEKTFLTLADLMSNPLIVSSQTPPAETKWFLNAVAKGKPIGSEVLRFPLTEAIVDAARAGMGIAVMSEWIATTYLGAGDLVVKRMKKPILRPWKIAYRKALATEAKQLAAALEHATPRVYIAI